MRRRLGRKGLRRLEGLSSPEIGRFGRLLARFKLLLYTLRYWHKGFLYLVADDVKHRFSNRAEILATLAFLSDCFFAIMASRALNMEGAELLKAIRDEVERLRTERATGVM